MRRLAVTLAVLAAVGAFGAIGLALALVGAGLPYPAATSIAALLAGCAAYVALDTLVVRPLSVLGSGAPGLLGEEVLRQRARLAALEATTSALCQDLHALLSPAVLVSSCLVAHPDPKVVRAGDTVIRAITRATDRLAMTRDPEAQARSAEKQHPGASSTTQQNHGTLSEEPAEPFRSSPSS